MGGGSGLLKSLRLRSGGKKKNKKGAKDEEISGAPADAASPSSPSSSSLPKTPRGFPVGAGGGVAITCGSGGRSFFRNHSHHLYDDNDSMINLSRSTAVETVTSSSATSTTSSAQPDPQQQASTSVVSSPSKGLLPSTPPKSPNGSPSHASVSSATFGTPKIRGKEVASKAALFESKSFHQSPSSDASSSVNTSFSSLSPPPSNSRRSATLKHRDFWQTVLKPTSSEDEEPDLVSASSGSNTADVRKKSQWLQSAFSPTGGGNMPGLDREDEDESTTQDLTETLGGDELEGDGSVSVLSESVNTATTTPVPPSPSYYNYWTASNTPPRRRSPDAAPALTLQDQVWTDAYQIWYQRGLLPWKPDFDECFPLQGVAEERSNQKSPLVASASPRDLEEEDHDQDDQFHDSFMDDDDNNDNENSARRDMWMGGGGDAAPASPGTVQASRTLHKTLTQSCPLLTVFGGNGNGNAPPAPAAVAVEAPVTPKAPATPKTPEAPATSPSTKSSSTSSTTSSPIKLLPSLTPSPSQLYSNYVNAYTAYVQDRHNPTKASAHNEARTLLERSRTRQPL
jgi:hypothetical protein